MSAREDFAQIARTFDKGTLTVDARYLDLAATMLPRVRVLPRRPLSKDPLKGSMAGLIARCKADPKPLTHINLQRQAKRRGGWLDHVEGS